MFFPISGQGDVTIILLLQFAYRYQTREMLLVTCFLEYHLPVQMNKYDFASLSLYRTWKDVNTILSKYSLKRPYDILEISIKQVNSK